MTANDNLMNAVIFILALNALMFMVGLGLESLGGGNPFNYEDNPLKSFNAGNETAGEYDVPSDPGSLLPSGIQSVSPDTGTYFTDIFSSIRNWLVDVTGLGFILSIFSGPKIILSAMGLPLALVWALTALWYGVSVLIIASYIFGR